MTLTELYQQGVSRVRLPPWNPAAFLLLLPSLSGHYAPWALLYDATEEPLRPMRICLPLVFEPDECDFEPYTEEMLTARRERFGQELEQR